MNSIKKLILITSILLLTGCVQNLEIANTNVEITASTNTTRAYQEDWLKLADGLNFRETPLYTESSSTNQPILLDVVTVFKFNPKKYNFSIQQDTTTPITVSEWQENADAFFVSNGGYFLEDNSAAGLLKIDGEQFGKNLTANSVGEFIINNNNQPNIKINSDIEDIDNLIQSYPLLVRSDGVESIEEDSGQTAPRTVIAKDSDGSFLFIFTQSYHFSLYKLQNWLAESDLDLTIALNLDGGPSSGYYLYNDIKKISESSEVPNVIIVEKK